jgi:hypothetical protein
MSAFQALDAARAAGVEVGLNGKSLVLSAATAPPTDVLDMLRRHKCSFVSLLQGRFLALRQPIQAWDPVDWKAFFDERAAIAEYDSGLPRAEAEARAFDCCVAEWMLRNRINSSQDRCLECGKSATYDALVPIGLIGSGEAWLHCGCVPAWRSARIAAAVAALSEMNIIAAPGTAPFRR